MQIQCIQFNDFQCMRMYSNIDETKYRLSILLTFYAICNDRCCQQNRNLHLPTKITKN